MKRLPRHSTLRVLAVAFACLLGIVLPRLLVVCTHADGIGWLEFAHAPGTCHNTTCHDAEHDSAPAAAATPAAPHTPLAAPTDCCEHTHLAVEILPPPRPAGSGIVLPAPAIAWAGPATPASATRGAVGLRPPSTGPPRTDQRAALRQTTLLLI